MTSPVTSFAAPVLSLLLLASLSGEVVISEFLASNQSGLSDEDGDESDWIEIQNTGTLGVDLNGWRLTDDVANPVKWIFPARIIEPGDYLVIFASDKNRTDPLANLHTNFKLTSSGEYLALLRADGSVASEFAPGFPEQLADLSYGIGTAGGVLVDENSEFFYHVPSSHIGASWQLPGFTDPEGHFVEGAQLGLGYDTGGEYAPLIGTTVATGTTSAYLRIPFEVDDPAEMTSLTLEMAYDDGFVAWLNGQKVAFSAGAPSNPVFNSISSVNHEAALDNPEIFDVSAGINALQPGSNVLAIQALNRSSGSSDFVAYPLLRATGATLDTGYLSTPTPGSVNVSTFEPGPAITSAQHEPLLPTDSDAIVVSTQVSPRFSTVSGVELRYRVMYGAETGLAMNDTGANGDQIAGDGVYTATIPASAASPGQMLRWRIVATDADGRESVEPAFSDQTGTNQSPEYLGTMIGATGIPTSLPIYYWFCNDVNNSRNRTGARASFFYEGVFHDNIYVRQRGGFTNNQSQKFDFNKGDSFEVDPAVPKVGEINLNANGADPSHLRQALSFQTFEEANSPGSIAFPVQLRLNGSFDRLATHIEQVDADFIRRENLPNDGELYKFVQRSNLRPVLNDTEIGVEKKTRESEDDSNLQAFIDGLKQSLAGTDIENSGSLIYSSAETAARQLFLFDNINVPEMVNYCATQVIIQDTDDTRKNFYLYHDSERSGEWYIFPWDKDFTFGIGESSDGQAKHPFWGDAQHKNANANQWNILFDALHNDPLIRRMILRRTRTLMDGLYKPSSTNAGAFFEPRIQALEAAVDPVLNIDSTGLLSEVNERRTDLYTSSLYGAAAPNLIPAAATNGFTPLFGAVDYNPTSGNQNEEFIELTNPHGEDLDLSGWTISGGIEMTLAGGTIIPAGGRLYLSPGQADFRARTTSPTGGEGHLVVGPYQGKLSNWGETLVLSDTSGTPRRSIETPVDPSDLQRYLVISEVHYHPLGNGEEEFIELLNTSSSVSLDLADVTLTGGVTFDFVEATITSLAPGERLLLVRNTTAFEAAYGNGLPVAGTFLGALDNAGESLKLDDASNSTILEFSYSPLAPWPLEADGLGASLVLIDPTLDPAEGSHWKASEIGGGTPGVGEGSLPGSWEAWQLENFTAGQIANPFVSSRTADPDGDGLVNFHEWAFASNPLVANPPSGEFVWSNAEGVARDSLRLTRPVLAVGLSYHLQASGDLDIFTEIPATMISEEIINGVETLVMVPDEEASGVRRFLRILVVEE